MSCVSVVMPLNRIDDFTLPAITSVLASKNVDLELIIVSDGLTDSALAKLEKKVNDGRVFVVHSDGKGIVAALQKGIDTARSEFIARMDGDDLCHPDRLSRQLDHLKSHKTTLVVGSNIDFVCAHGTRLGASRFAARVARGHLLKPFTSPVAHPTAMIRSSVFRAGVSYRNVFRDFQAEDFDLWYQILKLGGIDNLRGRYLQYRQHPDQVSTQRAKLVALSSLAVVLIDIHQLPNSAIKVWYEDPEGLVRHLMSWEQIRKLPHLRQLRARLYLGYLGAFELLQNIRKLRYPPSEIKIGGVTFLDLANPAQFTWSLLFLGPVALLHLHQIFGLLSRSFRRCRECLV
jgi:glycosyltransferase involved in cell wall biosynthesis